MPCATWLAAEVRAPVAAVQRGRFIVCRSGQINRVRIHQWRVTVRAAGR